MKPEIIQVVMRFKLQADTPKGRRAGIKKALQSRKLDVWSSEGYTLLEMSGRRLLDEGVEKEPILKACGKRVDG